MAKFQWLTDLWFRLRRVRSGVKKLSGIASPGHRERARTEATDGSRATPSTLWPPKAITVARGCRRGRNPFVKPKGLPVAEPRGLPDQNGEKSEAPRHPRSRTPGRPNYAKHEPELPKWPQREVGTKSIPQFPSRGHREKQPSKRKRDFDRICLTKLSLAAEALS
jgi:hypothetical protein